MFEKLVRAILASYPQDKLKEKLTDCGVSEDNINELLKQIYNKKEE